MTISEEIQPLSEKPARHCIVCGARVSDTATTCLICGADLTEQEKGEQAPQEETKKTSLLRIIILVVVAILILVGSVIIGLNLSESDVSAELPTFTITPSFTPTETPSPTTTPTATKTPDIPTPTPQPPEEYIVKEGDTLSGIAEQFEITMEDLLIFNNIAENEILNVGQSLLIPLAPPTPGPTPTLQPGEPTATHSPYILHTVRSGEALSTIAEQYGVDIATIKAANDIPADSDAIRLGQVLTIPQYTPTPEPTPEFVFTVTPTPGFISYTAPVMLYPPNKAEFTSDDKSIVLQWLTVGILDEREYYNVEVIITTATEKVTYDVYVQSTSWRIPSEWIPGEDTAEYSCSWRIYVVRQVLGSVEENYKIISTTTARRTFHWIQE
ncbi:MAG: LysM peptidoglycan-binding domain-containing protein [Anaerolineae bacterium]|nr:LysM peptidoglycan-binding domain-containing protein [Anaerolineae bacterium]